MNLTEDQLHGLPVLRLQGEHVEAAFSLHGGQLLSFVPHGDADWLWLSPITTRPPGAIRGGVPVCWPYFGREGQPADVPQHGFARTTAWELASCEARDEGEVQIDLVLPASAATPLRLRQSWRLGRSLSQSLTTTHEGDAPLRLTQALHSYFRTGDAAQAWIEGLDGLDYFDRYDGQPHRQAGRWSLADARDPGRSDRTYHHAGGRYTLHDPVLRRRLEITTGGSASVVVWNPGADGARAMADVPDEAWPQFVCIEASNAARDVVELQPGQRHTLQQHVRVRPL